MENNVNSKKKPLFNSLDQSSSIEATRDFFAINLRQFLKLAAAPVFGVMAILSAAYSGDLASICFSSENSFIPLGMDTMYALMAIFHFRPWLDVLENSQNKESNYEVK